MSRILETPSVSCLMATWNRPWLARLAVRCFLAQDLQDAELIVLDDSANWTLGWLPQRDGRVSVVRVPVPMSRGQKFNLGMEYARGPVAALWADDDWHAPRRLSMQLQALRAARAEVCGMDRVWWHDLRTGETWRYSHRADGKKGASYVVGGTLMFTRRFWEGRRFDEAWDVGEDNLFVRGRVQAGVNYANVDDESWYVAFEHGQNEGHARPRNYRHAQFQPVAGGRFVIEGWGCDVGLWAAAVGREPRAEVSGQWSVVSGQYSDGMMDDGGANRRFARTEEEEE